MGCIGILVTYWSIPRCTYLTGTINTIQDSNLLSQMGDFLPPMLPGPFPPKMVQDENGFDMTTHIFQARMLCPSTQSSRSGNPIHSERYREPRPKFTHQSHHLLPAWAPLRPKPLNPKPPEAPEDPDLP